MNTTAVSKIDLQDIVDFNDSPEKFDFYVDDRDRPVKFYDEYGNDGDYFLFGFEYGPTLLVRAKNEYDAYEVFLDELPPVPMDEIHEAYYAFDKLLEHMISMGHEHDYQLRCFCNRWCKFYFEADTRDANMTGAWDRWELDESYQYQSNSTGSGIVNVGHYEWMREIPVGSIKVSRKVAE